MDDLSELKRRSTMGAADYCFKFSTYWSASKAPKTTGVKNRCRQILDFWHRV